MGDDKGEGKIMKGRTRLVNKSAKGVKE